MLIHPFGNRPLLPFFDQALKDKVVQQIVEPTIAGLEKDGLEYKGFVFIGLMIGDGAEPMVIEYNCRMGDPETEVVMPRLKSDLVKLLQATASGYLKGVNIEIDPLTAATIVAVSGGYPGDYEKGLEIHGLEDAEATDSIVFHAGTLAKGDKIVTNGGRVLAVTSFGNDIKAAVEISKETLMNVYFEGVNYRHDIGYEFS